MIGMAIRFGLLDLTKFSIYRIRGERCYQSDTFGVRKITPKV